MKRLPTFPFTGGGGGRGALYDIWVMIVSSERVAMNTEIIVVSVFIESGEPVDVLRNKS